MELLPCPAAVAVAGPQDPAPPLVRRVVPRPRQSHGAASCLGQWHSLLMLPASPPSSGRKALLTYRDHPWRRRPTGAVVLPSRLHAASLRETAVSVCFSGSSTCLSRCLYAIRPYGVR